MALGKAVLKKRVGFTLLELMVVLSIISVLAAIAIPNFFGFKRSGYNVSVKNDLKNAFMASQVFYSKNPEGVIVDGSDLFNEGYVQTEDVILDVLIGTQDSLKIKAYHVVGGATYLMDQAGHLSEL